MKIKWYMRDSVQLTMLGITVILCVCTAFVFIWLSSIEGGNRQAICQSRALLEENKAASDFDTMDKARLALARRDSARCK